MTERIKFTVFRDTWLRGTGDGRLLDEKGCRCCLGFLGQSVGCSDENQLNVGVPEELEDQRWPRTLVSVKQVEDEDFDGEPIVSTEFGDTSITDQIVSVNDDKGITDGEREERLARLFGEAGIDVEFLDTAPTVAP